MPADPDKALFKLDPDTKAMLATLASEDARSADRNYSDKSATVRQLIRDEFARRTGAKKSSKKSSVKA
jgi:hypothetical protein